MTIERILVIKVRSLGDTLLATPALRALKAGYPQAQLTTLVSPLGQAVLEGNPDVDRIWVYDKVHMGLFKQFKLWSQLAKEHFDLAVALHASSRTAYLAKVSKAPQRVVHNHSGKNYHATVPILAKKESKSAIERDLDAVRALNLAVQGSELTLVIPTEAEAQAQAFIAANGLKPKAFYILAPGAGQPKKRWTAAAAAEFLSDAPKVLGRPWVILAGPDEVALVAELKTKGAGVVPVFTGSVKAAAALIRASAGMLTMDSGPKHLAAAVRTKTLTLWTREPVAEWHPYDLSEHAILNSPTGIVADLQAESVMAAAEKHFGRFLHSGQH